MRVYQERIMNISRHYTILVRINVINVICNVNAFSLPSLWRFRNPDVLIWWFLLHLHEMLVEISILIRKNIWIRNDVKRALSMNLLHFQNILCKLVFSSDFKWIGEMINLLEFIQPFINIWFTRCIYPHYIPIMAFCVMKPSCL